MNTWNTNKADLPKPKLYQTAFVWVKTKHDKVYLASFHTENKLWYLSKEMHKDFPVMQDSEVVAWQPFAPPDDELNKLFVEMAARIEVIVGLEVKHPDPYFTQDFKDGLTEVLMRVRKKVME
jgi:hypothetical protein